MGIEKLLIAMASISILSAGSTNAAPKSADVVQVKEAVRYDDLDLTSGKDQARLKRRIFYAANRVCAEPSSTAPEPAGPNAKCYRAAMMNARAQMEAAIARTNAQPTFASTSH